MEFLDEEARPRVLFQSRPSPSSSSSEPQALTLNRPSLYISLSLSSLLFAISIFFLQSEPLRSLLLWFSLSLLLGPFAPSSLTAGDIRVGLGPVVEFDSTTDTAAAADEDDSRKRGPNRRSRGRKFEESGFTPGPIVAANGSEKGLKSGENRENGSAAAVEEEVEEREWSEADLEVLKKQLVKNPVGMPRRWEAIAEAFGGRHGVQSVIRRAKSMGEKKTGDSDSFARFLKDRKPVDRRVEEEIEAMRENGGESWNSGEDIALLNALKAFPKDAPMRWEKIEAAVPGKSKAACMKRVTELKRDFRSSKAS